MRDAASAVALSFALFALIFFVIDFERGRPRLRGADAPPPSAARDTAIARSPGVAIVDGSLQRTTATRRLVALQIARLTTRTRRRAQSLSVRRRSAASKVVECERRAPLLSLLSRTASKRVDSSRRNDRTRARALSCNSRQQSACARALRFRDPSARRRQRRRRDGRRPA